MHSIKSGKWVKVILFISLLAFFVSCKQAADSEGLEERTLVYGLTLVPSGIDPHIHASAELGIPLRSVYDTLVYRDAEIDDFVAGLASEWRVSEDGLTYTFQLRQDVVFHDGEVFNADAVRVNLQRVLAADTNSFKAASLLGPVDRVEVIDEYTVAIVLRRPFAPLLDGLSQPYLGMASPLALQTYDTATYQFHQVGTGPYGFVEYIVNDRLVLERNPDYAWAPDSVNAEAFYFDRIVFRFYTDPATRTLALQTGEVDIVGEMLPSDARALVADGLAQLLVSPVPGQPLQFVFNTNLAPTSSLEVRQAIILATDRAVIVQAVFQGYSPIAYGPLSAATRYYDPSVESYYPYDPVLANELLDSTGWVDTNEDGWRDQDGEALELILVVPPWGLLPEIAQIVESQWESTLALKVRVDQVASYPQLIEKAEAGNYHLLALNFFGYDPVFMTSFYTTDGRLNYSRHVDSGLDAWLLAAEVSTSDDERRELYADIQIRVMDQALILPIRSYVNLNGLQPDIQGLHFDSQGWFPYLADVYKNEFP